MDFTKLSRFIIIVGTLILLAGGAVFIGGARQVVSSQDAVTLQAMNTKFSDYETNGDQLHTQRAAFKEHIAEGEKDKELGLYIALAGAVVLLLGLGMKSSVTPPKDGNSLEKA